MMWNSSNIFFFLFVFSPVAPTGAILLFGRCCIYSYTDVFIDNLLLYSMLYKLLVFDMLIS